jgi:hypothetical protein
LQNFIWKTIENFVRGLSREDERQPMLRIKTGKILTKFPNGEFVDQGTA